MNYKYKVKQITRLYESCNECGLPTINCICSSASKVRTESKIWILSTEKEFYRPSNTARLLKLVNPDSTEIILWERTRKPEKLIENINSGLYETYLLFPTEDGEQLNRKDWAKSSEKPLAFIIIDGTWKEAKKILRKSDYLKNIPVVSLDTGVKSEYDLRRGADEGDLCTIEAAIEALKISHEVDNAKVIKDVFDLFVKSFKVGISGHKLYENNKNRCEE